MWDPVVAGLVLLIDSQGVVTLLDGDDHQVWSVDEDGAAAVSLLFRPVQGGRVPLLFDELDELIIEAREALANVSCRAEGPCPSPPSEATNGAGALAAARGGPHGTSRYRLRGRSTFF
jgi:hypothetical protein